MRNAESFMQIKVTNVAAKVARRSSANQGIHVGTVNVNLAAMMVNDFT
jgi:hypothetical protein